MIRSATVSDAASLTELWHAAGLRFHPELTERELASALRPDLVLVEEDAGAITGAVFGTFDGVRGWVRHLATRPDRHGQPDLTAVRDRVPEGLPSNERGAADRVRHPALDGRRLRGKRRAARPPYGVSPL